MFQGIKGGNFVGYVKLPDQESNSQPLHWHTATFTN